jgi:hypothetical protein
VLAAGAVRHRGCDEHIGAGFGEPLAQRDRDVGIGGQRQVRTVLLGRAQRHGEHALRRDAAADVRPRQVS